MIQNKRASLEPINLIMGFVALVGAILIIFNQVNYGLILLVISTLIEAIQRVFR
jgi:hypothetical protein